MLEYSCKIQNKMRRKKNANSSYEDSVINYMSILKKKNDTCGKLSLKVNRLTFCFSLGFFFFFEIVKMKKKN